MVRRSTLFVVVIFLVLVGLVYFLQRSGKLAETEATPTEAEQFLFSFPSPIIGVRLEKVGQGTVELEKDSQEKWNLITPPAPATDSGQVETAISQLMTLRIAEKLDQPPSLEDAGLTTPAYRLLVRLQDGTQETMSVGKETPTGSNYYVQVSNRGIFIVNKYSLDAFLKLVDEPPILLTPTPTAGTATPGQGSEPAVVESATPAP